jgi:hypothetical protein
LLPLSQFGSPTNDRLKASIDEFVVWNYPRSATDISNSYAFRLFAPGPGLVLLWHFDEATNATPVALDASGNGNYENLSSSLARAISTAPILTNSLAVTNLNDSGFGTLLNALGLANSIGGELSSTHSQELMALIPPATG